MERGADHIRLLKKQWVIRASDLIQDVIDELPDQHQERPGLIRAQELLRAYGETLQ